MGVLWAEFLSTEVELEQVEVRRADFPFHFRLPQPRGKGQMRFSECAFGSLVIPSEFPRAVVFETCSFRELRLEGKSKDCTFSSCAIDVVSTKKRYTDLPYEVAGVLESAGVTVTGMAEVSVTDGVSELTRVARMFLGKMDASVVMSIVVGADGLPEEDPRLGWIMRFSDQWKSFLRALEKHHLGYRVQVTASGNEKFRVRLELPPNEILNPSGTDARVVAFWGALA